MKFMILSKGNVWFYEQYVETKKQGENMQSHRVSMGTHCRVGVKKKKNSKVAVAEGRRKCKGQMIKMGG